MIPAEAVEAAKEAMREVTPPPGVTKSEWLAKHGEFALIAGAIAAAAPYLVVEAWDEGEDAGYRNSNASEWGNLTIPNPYKQNGTAK